MQKKKKMECIQFSLGKKQKPINNPPKTNNPNKPKEAEPPHILNFFSTECYNCEYDPKSLLGPNSLKDA